MELLIAILILPSHQQFFFAIVWS